MSGSFRAKHLSESWEGIRVRRGSAGGTVIRDELDICERHLTVRMDDGSREKIRLDNLRPNKDAVGWEWLCEYEDHSCWYSF